MQLHADKLQLRPGWRTVTPELPGGQKIQSRAKTRFTNTEAGRGILLAKLREALRQVVVVQEYMAAFGQTVRAREVDIIKGPGDRLSLFVPENLSRLYGFAVNPGVVGHNPNSHSICLHHCCRRLSVRLNSFSSSSARPTNRSPSGVRALEASKV